MKTLIANILLIITVLPSVVHAQDYSPVTLANTEIRSLTSSKVQGYEYKIYVALPDGYQSSMDNYPVVYFLDASNQFAMFVQTYRLLRAFNEIPPLLLVGIAHENNFISDRARDFTPTHLTQEQVKERYGPGMANFFPVSGGANEFLQFIKDEAIPFIEKEYRVKAYERGLFGHSAGGLFVAYTLFNTPKLFDKYLIASSAVWWDNYIVLQDETVYNRNHKNLEASVLATVGGEEGELIVGAWKHLRDRLESRSYSGLDFSAIMMERESHVSVPPRTYSRALRVLYGSDP